MQRQNEIRLYLAVIICAVFISCTVDDPDAPKKETMDALVAKHATRAEVEATIRCGCTWYPYGSGTDMVLRAAESSRQKELVQNAIDRRRDILHHTTMWQQTLMVFDESDRIESYWFASQ